MALTERAFRSEATVMGASGLHVPFESGSLGIMNVSV